MYPSPARRFVLLAGLVLLLALAGAGCKRDSEPIAAPGTNPANPGGPASYLFCFWNVENFFDDKLDHRKGPGDREYDPLFADNPDLLQLKLKKLGDVLLALNEGKGPDILAIVEVESVRAAELLKDALNARLADPVLHYKNVVMKEVAGGRHIAPAVITRLRVLRDRTRLLGNRQRILEAHLDVNDHPLVVIASHWASRLEKGSETRRASYANAIYGRVRAMYKANANVDVLVCGDFNDTPEDPSVTEHLHATGDVEAVLKPADGLRLLNLMAGKDPTRFGTHYYHRWFIFDQIIVSPGMLDPEGWSCDPKSVQTVRATESPRLTLYNPRARVHYPWKFGGPRTPKGARGYSDHFPVTVQLKVAGP
jgi:endonuclease/exonuclease/phosphatase family metal-dependent hydrolase